MLETSIQSFIKSVMVAVQSANPQSATDLRLNKLPKDSVDLQELSKSVNKVQYGAFNRAYNELVNLKTQGVSIGEAAIAIAEELSNWINEADEKFPAVVEKKKVPTKKPVKLKDNTSNLTDLFYTICHYDALFDLLTGNLHRLDPVIQDAGCQWRVPFVIDIHEIAIQKCTEWQDGDYKHCLEEYAEIRKNCINLKGFLKDYSELRTARGVALKNYKGKEQVKEEIELFEFIDQINVLIADHLKTLESNAKGFFALCEYLCPELDKWGRLVDQTFDCITYLDLCKVFTINRVRRMDCFGLSGVRIDYTLPLIGSKEVEYTKKLADCSSLYMGHIATHVCDNDDVVGQSKPISHVMRDLVTTCKLETYQNTTTYETHVFYGPLKLIFAYQSVKKQPIIIDIRRIRCTPQNNVVAYHDDKSGLDYNEAEYVLDGAAILYFEPDDFGVFQYVPEPSEEQMSAVGMCVECFSIYRPDMHGNVQGVNACLFPNDFISYLDTLAYRCSIMDMILWSSSMHDETPSPIFNITYTNEGIIEKKERVSDDNGLEVIARNTYIEAHDGKQPGQAGQWSLLTDRCQLYGVTVDDCHLWQERETFLALVQSLGCNSIAYKKYVGGRTAAVRTDEPVIFSPIHIYGCTYKIKLQELLNFMDENKNVQVRSGRMMNPDDEHDKVD